MRTCICGPEFGALLRNCTAPSHVSVKRTAIAKHCISARLTLINHSIALVRAAHVHGNEPRAPCWHWAHVSFTLARASPELDLLNLRRVLQKAAGSGEVVNHGVEKKIPSAAEAGGSIGCYCCRCFSRHGISNISTDM